MEHNPLLLLITLAVPRGFDDSGHQDRIRVASSRTRKGAIDAKLGVRDAAEALWKSCWYLEWWAHLVVIILIYLAVFR